MTHVESLEQQVAKLPSADLAAFRQWFEKFDAAAWDAQLETDAGSGKLEGFAAEALAEYRAGKVREI